MEKQNDIKQKLYLLILEDNPKDAELLVNELKENDFDFEWERVETKKEFIEALTKKPDIILADYKLPTFEGMSAIKIQQETAPDIPIIIVSGIIGEELIVECMKAGANGYVLKAKLSRLSLVVERSLKEAAERREFKKANEALKESEKKYHAIFEATGTATLIVEEDTTIVNANKECEETTGYKVTELIGKSWTKFVHKDDLKLMLNRHNVRRENNKSVPNKYEVRLIDAKGNVRNTILSIGMVPYGGRRTVSMVDVTELKQAGETLRKEKKFNENLLETANSFIIVLDKNANIILFNRYAEKLSGYKKEEVLGKNWFTTFIPKQNNSKIPKVFADVLREMPNVSSYENPILCKNGVEKLINWENSLLKNDKGEILGILSIGTDITESKLAELALRESKVFNETLLNASPDIIYIYDIVENRNVYSNDGIMKILGYTKEELQEMGKQIIPQLMHPDDFKIYSEKTYPQYQRMSDYELHTHEYRMKHKNGDWYWLLSKESVFLRDTDGNPNQIFGIVSDITERKRAEETLAENDLKYRSLFDNKLNGLAYCKIVVDENNRPVDYIFLEINRAFEEFTGLKKEVVLGKRITEVIPGFEKSDFDFIGVHGKVALTGEEVRFEQYQEQLKRWYSVYLYSPKKEYFVSIFSDITAQKLAEEQIKSKNLFLESLIQQSPLPTFVMDSKGFNVMVNEAFLKFYAVPDKDMVLGRNALTEPANLSQGVVKYFKEAFKGKIVEPPDIEFVSPHENKKVITRCKMFPILDPTDTLTNVVVIQEDITDHKQTEEKLKKSENRFRSMFENHSAVMLLIEPDSGKILDSNTSASAFYGYSHQELISMNIEDINVSKPEEVKKNRKLAEAKEVNLFNFKHRLKNNTLRDVQVHSTPIEYMNQKLLFSIIYDITERKQADKKIHLQLEELSRWHNAMLNREERVLELKREINKLLTLSGKPIKYPSVI